MGAVDVAAICALTLTVEPELVAGAALIGTGYCVGYKMMV
jgi:hypothetical protein